jgi:hypothetical protein
VASDFSGRVRVTVVDSAVSFGAGNGGRQTLHGPNRAAASVSVIAMRLRER